MLETKFICNMQRMRPRITILSSLGNLPEIGSDFILLSQVRHLEVVEIRPLSLEGSGAWPRSRALKSDRLGFSQFLAL